MDIREALAASPLFLKLPPEALDALAQHVSTRQIRGGEVLFRHGDAADSLYIVVTGRLRALAPDGTVYGEIGRGEPIGEIGLLADEPRGATVHALRDSLLLRMDRRRLRVLIARHPMGLLEASRVILQRLRQNQRVQRLEAARGLRSFCVLPALPEHAAAAAEFARNLAAELALLGPVRLVDVASLEESLGLGRAQTLFDDAECNEQLLTWLNQAEADHRYLVYVSGPHADAWARRCMRQADHVLLYTDCADPPLRTAMLDEIRLHGAHVPLSLLVRRPRSAGAGAVMAWRENSGAGAHYFLRPDTRADIASIARQLTGRAIGLVLGGGGARGFTHIGLLRALRTLGLPVDLCGGTSMGAFFAALVACGYDDHEIIHIARETFVSRNHLNDYMVPGVALIRGRKFVRRLHEVFGDRLIEHLRMPYFCVSTNLTRGTAMLHDRGPLHLWAVTSMAVPGVAPPIVYRGDLLVDGAVVNSLPTDIMQNLGRGPIIASDVSTAGDLRAPGIEGPDPEGLFRFKTLGRRPSMFSIIFRTATLTSESGVAARAARADAYLRMPVTGVGLFDWKRMDELVERGYQHALEQLAPQRDALLKGDRSPK